MKEQPGLPHDLFLNQMLPEIANPAPSVRFKTNVMQAITAAESNQARLSKPLISRQVWQRLSLGIGLLLLLPLGVAIFYLNRWSEIFQVGIALSLSERIALPTSGLPSLISCLPQVAVITGVCFVILLLDRFCQRLQSR